MRLGSGSYTTRITLGEAGVRVIHNEDNSR